MAAKQLVFDETARVAVLRSEEHTSELQSQSNLVCRLLLEKKKNNICLQDGILARQYRTWAHLLRSAGSIRTAHLLYPLRHAMLYAHSLFPAYLVDRARIPR